MNVELPNGVIIEDVPKGTSQAQIKALAIKNKLALESDFPPSKATENQVVPQNIKEQSTTDRIKRQLELTGRYGAEGVADIVDMAANPVKLALNAIPGADFNYGANTYRNAVTTGLNNLNVAAPETKYEKIVAGGARAVAGVGPFFNLGSLLNKSANTVTQNVGNQLLAAPLLQGVSAVSAGTAGETAKQDGQHPLVQFGSALLAGLTPAGVKYTLQAIKKNMPIPSQDIDMILFDSDINTNNMTQAGVSRLKKKISDALKAGSDVDAAMLNRLADFERTGATATKGSITLDPIDITQEKNLAKIGANSGDSNMQILARLEGENNTQLINQLNDISPDEGLDLYRAGENAIKPILAKQQQLKQNTNELYDLAKDSGGRALPLNRGQFVNRVDELLVEANKTSFLPDNIKSIINTISLGEVKVNGITHPVPFNVNTIDQLKTTLSTAQRGSADGNIKSSLSLVRQALDETQLQGGASDDAIKAFDNARAQSAKMFAWEKSTPAIKAIVNGTDPDRFMDKFILGKGATYDDVAKLVDEIRIDADAFGTVKSQIASWIKSKALNGKPDEIGILSSSNLDKALQKIGDRKLNLFFNRDELAQLKTIQRVASYTQAQPAGSAVNNSNSGALGLGGLLDWMTNASPTASMVKSAVAIH